jgi:uracil-DNA glycosylase family 4
MFTGDRSGDWLHRAMHRAGLASQPLSINRGDGLKLIDAYVTAVVRCAPPANKPTPGERDNCLPYLVDELRLLKDVRAIIALGAFAWDGVHRALAELGHTVRPRVRFAHAARAQAGPYRLYASYHPSQQNTFTRRLTEPMFDAVFRSVMRAISRDS